MLGRIGTAFAALACLVLLSSMSLAGDPDPSMPPPDAPGAINQDVTQANIATTICVKGWTKTIRPPASFTDKLKIAQLKALGYADQDPAHYEEDHRISLEVGGNPTDAKNLWPEPYAGQWGARVKDQLEDELHRLVCSGKMPLADAQAALMGNWEDAYTKFVVKH